MPCEPVRLLTPLGIFYHELGGIRWFQHAAKAGIPLSTGCWHTAGLLHPKGTFIAHEELLKTTDGHAQFPGFGVFVSGYDSGLGNF